MQYSKVEICGVNTAKLKVLKEKEKIELLRRIKEGDASARDDLVNGNLRLVLSVIQRFTNRGENLDDLFQVGCIGLMKAIDNFDISQNVRFSTYAVPMIIGCRNKEEILMYQPIKRKPYYKPLYNYSDYSKEYWLKIFKDEYNRINPKSQSQFNRERTEGIPQWEYVAKRNNIKTWSELLHRCRIITFSDRRHKPKIHLVSICESDIKIKRLNQKLKKILADNS